MVSEKINPKTSSKEVLGQWSSVNPEGPDSDLELVFLPLDCDSFRESHVSLDRSVLIYKTCVCWG